MKTISKYILILISLFISGSVLAQEKGDAVFNKVVHEYTLKTDGSSEYREYKEVKLLSHMAFHRLYGETFVIYDPLYQELVIKEAYTVMADGRRVDVPKNAFNEVLPRAASHAAPYNHLREMVITHTGLEVGATVFLDYTIKTKAGYYPAFMGEELIKDIVPVKSKEVIIHIPADQELHYKMLNLRTSPEITIGKGINTYTFTFASVSAYASEWGTKSELLPRLFFSSAKDLERAYFPFVGQDAFTFQLTPDMAKAISMIKEGKEDDLEVALAIHKMVVNEIGTWNLPLQYTGFKCRTPAEVWKSNAGTHLEKNILLATLLNGAELRSVPVAIIPEKYYDRKVGSLFMFKDFAVQLKTADGGEIYLSATQQQKQDLAFKLQGKKMLILDGAIESLRTYDPTAVRTEIIYEGKLVNGENEKLKGKLNIKLIGAANPYFSLLHDTAYAKKYAEGAQEVKLRRLNPDESEFDIEVVMKNVIQQYGEYVFMDLPASAGGISSWGYSYIESERKTSIHLKELISEKYEYEIEVPEGYILVSPEAYINIQNDIGHLEINIQQKGNSIHTMHSIQINKAVVDYGEYDAFNDIWNAWMNTKLNQLVLKKQD